MTTLHLTDFYELPGDRPLEIDAELVGGELSVVDGDDAITVTFPPWPWEQGPWADLGDRAPISEGRSTDNEPTAFRVTIVRARVDFEGEVQDSDFEQIPTADLMDNSALIERGFELVWMADDAQLVAQKAIRQMLGWIRMGQPWLGFADDLPRPLREALVEDDGGRQLREGPSGKVSGKVPGFYEGEPAPTLRRIDLDVLKPHWSKEPHVPETLLADAHYLAFWREPPDLAREVLSAAIACEVKAKTTLVKKASEEVGHLLGVIIREYRNFPRGLERLIDQVAKASCGRSFREDDSATFARIKRLVELRNDVVHRAKPPPDHTEVREVVAAARALFTWLEAFPEPPG